MRSNSGTEYDIAGSLDAPAVFLIHGLGLTGKITWAEIGARLAQKFRVISYDLCGHGRSAMPEGEMNLARLGRQLVELMDELEIERAALVGFSLGGMINRRVAMDDAERVSALVVLNSPHERGEERQKTVEAQARAAASSGPEAGIEDALARWFTEKFRAEQSDKVKRIRETVLATDARHYAAHRWVLANGVRELIRPPKPLCRPTLVMTCENDIGSNPQMARAIAGEMKEAETIIVPDLKHLGLIEKPQAFGDPIEAFLTRILA